LEPIENHHDLHCCVANAFIAINERMVLNQREAQTGNLVPKTWVQILAGEALPRLSQSGFEKAQIPETLRTTTLLNQLAVKSQDLSQGQPTHQAKRRYSSLFLASTS